MRMSKLYLPTLKEDPAEAEIPSHKLMLRAGMMRKHSAGIYSFLPLGNNVINKIKNIIKNEMDKYSKEILLPVIQKSKIWKESGRWEKFGPLMIKFNDRNEREYCLGPTHEEVITELIRDEVRSYKDLPFILYQIQTKVRDEIRPRFGVMRAREFIMKDAYSFDKDQEGLDKSYQDMYQAYSNIFENCGLETSVVEADSGAMGGKDSHEFMVLAENGEDEIAICTECDYAANVETASSKLEKESVTENAKLLTKKETPNIKTIDELVDYLNIKAKKMIKAIALLVDGEPVLALVRGDDELNEIKLSNILQAQEINRVEKENINELFNSEPGFIGPIGLSGVKIFADKKIKYIKNGVSGANEKDRHYLNVNPERDFDLNRYCDIRKVKTGDKCIHCNGKLTIKHGIEVGHIFKLGTKYSDSLNAKYLDENGKEQAIVMGSYGIGVSRLIAAAIEQNHDQNGIIWPQSIAPYQVIILPLGNKGKIIEVANNLYQILKDEGIDVLIDDRKERAGVKFNDADLIGIPIRITIGSRSLEKNEVEIKLRDSEQQENIPVSQTPAKIKSLLE